MSRFKIKLIKSKLKTLFRVQKVWSKPKCAKVLVYDRAGSDLFSKYLDESQMEILDTRGESINMFVLFNTIFKGLNIDAYESMYINLVSPDIIITFIDNNPKFYRLKKIKPEITTIFVQNGWRNIVADIFGQLILANENEITDLFVDHMLCFGNPVCKEYSTFIKGKTMPIGSFINNMTSKIEAESTPNSVLFISQYRRPPVSSEMTMFLNGSDKISWTSFYSSEAKLLPLLLSFCKKRGLNLRICGCSTDEVISEQIFYKNILGNDKWDFLPRYSSYTSYNHIDTASYIVMIDSTLGYEALARGKKVAAFTIRGKAMKSLDFNFGWPKKFPDIGPFWTNNFCKAEFIRIMNYITTIDDHECEENRIRYVDEIIEFDPGNSKFLNLMKNLRVPLISK